MNYIDVNGTPIIANVEEILMKLMLSEGWSTERKRVNSNIMINCPFHNDKTPSMGITFEEFTKYSGDKIPPGTVNCFGCGYSNDLVGFISDFKEIRYTDAEEWLKENFEVGEYDERKIDIDIKRENSYEVKDDIKLLDEWEDYCEFLAKRGIRKEDALQYKLKYNNKNKTVIFPIITREQELIGYQERKVNNKQFFSEGNVNTLFGMHLLGNGKKLWLVEGPIDCVVTNKYENNVVAIVGGLSDEKIKQIRKLDYPILICGFDNDEAGDKYSKRIANEFKDRMVKRAFYVDGEDPGDIPYDFDYNLKYMI